MASYRGRQTEDRLLGHQPLSEVNVVFKVWEVIHVNSHLNKRGQIQIVL